MKEQSVEYKLIPLLMHSEMVNAIVGKLKTKTRRLKGLDIVNGKPDEWDSLGLNDFGEWAFVHPSTDRFRHVRCLYGNPGDILWVRENWAPSVVHDEPELGYAYQGDYIDTPRALKQITWKPSIHMPYLACRLFLRILSINIERLHDITEEDAIKEGVIPTTIFKSEGKEVQHYFDYTKGATMSQWQTAYGSFMSLWQAVNGRESWDENPWVWVIEFEHCDKPANLFPNNIKRRK